MTELKICPQCVLGPGTCCEEGIPFLMDDDNGNGNGNRLKCRAWVVGVVTETANELPLVCKDCIRTPSEIENDCCENCQLVEEVGYCKYSGGESE